MPDEEPEPESELGSAIEMDAEIEEGEMSIGSVSSGLGSDFSMGSEEGEDSGGKGVGPELSAATVRTKMLRTCTGIEDEVRQEMVRLESEVYSLKIKTVTTKSRQVIARNQKQILRLEMQLNNIVASKEGASVCIVVVEASGKSGLFRTDKPGTKGRVDIHSWYMALKPLLVPQGGVVQEAAAEALATGNYKYLLPDPSKTGRASRGSFSFERGGGEEVEADDVDQGTPEEQAVAQSEGNAVVLSGHPNKICNGEYWPAAELQEGWPHYESRATTDGFSIMHLFRSVELQKWFLSRKFVPQSELNSCNILAEDGPVPVGLQTWRCYVKGDQSVEGSKSEWVDQDLTVEMTSVPLLEARSAVARATEEGDTATLEAAKEELDRLEEELAAEEEDDEGSVATTGLMTKVNAPGIGTPQSVFAVRARTRALVLPDQAKFEPWRNGMRRKCVDQRKELLISQVAGEWIPCGFKKPGQCAAESKVESLTTGFMYPAENEKPDLP